MESDVLTEKVSGQVRRGNWRGAVETLLDAMLCTADDYGDSALREHIERIATQVFDIP
ncbi:hypothetical protein HIJ39_20765, partial [Sulfobacillus sp. DSM 109850]|nr:hypothetical protein [Sulfobacillus harzensis]